MKLHTEIAKRVGFLSFEEKLIFLLLVYQSIPALSSAVIGTNDAYVAKREIFLQFQCPISFLITTGKSNYFWLLSIVEFLSKQSEILNVSTRT